MAIFSGSISFTDSSSVSSGKNGSMIEKLSIDNYSVYVRCCSLLVVGHVEMNRYLEKLREDRFVNGGVSRRMPENHCKTT